MEDSDVNKRPPTKKHIITIGGRPGSGKSTAAKTVAVKLGYRHFSSGDLYRMLANERGTELLQANISAKTHEAIDPLVDGRLREIGAKDDEVVIDSRTAWHWIPSSFKVFLDLELAIGARRILAEMSEGRLKNEEVSGSPSDYAETLQRRLEGETERYKNKYGINPYDLSNYDLIIQTAHNDPSQTVEILLQGYKKWVKE